MAPRLVRALLAAVLMLLGSTSVRADTWSVQYFGTGTLNSDCRLHPNCPPPTVGIWNPVLTFETNSSQDGSYTSAFYVLIDSVARVMLTDDFFAGEGAFDTDQHSAAGVFVAKLRNDEVVSIYGDFFGNGDQHWSISLESISYSNPAGSGSFGFATSAIPEPASYALLMSGLALIGVMRRRRRPTR
jgi:hypothetical protein